MILRFKEDRLTLAVVIAYFVVFGSSWIFWNEFNIWVKILSVILNCYLSFSCAVIVHNTIHYPIFYNRKANKIFQYILSLTYGHPVTAFVSGHNFSHHKFTQTLKDSQRTTKMRFKINFFNQLLFAFVMANDILKSELRFAKKMYNEKPKWFWQYFTEFAIVILVKVSFAIFDWRLFIFLILIPHQYAVWGILGTNYFQHDGCDESHPYNHSRSFSGKLLNVVLFNNGFHTAHHHKPGLHWSQLPEYHDKHIRPFLHPELDRVSLFDYLWKTHIYPGKRVDFLGNPVVLPPKQEDEDWVNEVKVKDYQLDLAES